MEAVDNNPVNVEQFANLGHSSPKGGFQIERMPHLLNDPAEDLLAIATALQFNGGMLGLNEALDALDDKLNIGGLDNKITGTQTEAPLNRLRMVEGRKQHDIDIWCLHLDCLTAFKTIHRPRQIYIQQHQHWLKLSDQRQGGFRPI